MRHFLGNSEYFGDLVADSVATAQKNTNNQK